MQRYHGKNYILELRDLINTANPFDNAVSNLMKEFPPAFIYLFLTKTIAIFASPAVSV